MDSKRNLGDMTTPARTRTEQDEDLLALSLSLSLSQPSSFGGVDLSLTLSHTTTASPLPPQPHTTTASPLPPQPLPLPNSNYWPTHPANVNPFPHQPSCRNSYAVDFVHNPNGWPPAVSPIPLSASIQQQPQPTSSPSTEQRRRRSPPPPPPSLPMSRPPQRSIRQPRQTIPEGKDEFINPPFPWFTNRRATVYPLDKLLEMEIRTVHGSVQCRKCEFPVDMEYELQPKFKEVANLILEKGHTMHNCALPEWMNPTFPPCPSCQTPNCMKPVIAAKKRHINWLFLLLGQSIGTCTLDQLKYFCKHTKQHRTGSKNRLLFSTYIGICKQLDPDGTFDDI